MVRLFVFLAAAQLVLLVLALISCLAADRVRNLPRALWVLVVLFVPLIGPMAYYLWGRPVAAHGVNPYRPRPASPDDDPEFLRSMNSEQARRDRELLSQWERDLHEPEPERPRDEEREPDGHRNANGDDAPKA
ncbi:PLD nuclease N-terminal domain-containing protein [Actinoplanes sp. NPDC051470]|uniref:PLD nuclease N-terminal domain-containing protein n=1 Tax=unclassified Actinoplanes TaxID=2626549 RepID=UPI00342AF78B